jgi:hypothetical protein
MHREISQFPSKYFYGGLLKDADSVESREALCEWRAPFKPFCFFDVNSKEDQRIGTESSRSNQDEADLIASMVNQIVTVDFPSIGWKGKIAVISPYKRQIQTVKQALRNRIGESALDKDGLGIEVGTVDGFQVRFSSHHAEDGIHARTRTLICAGAGEGRDSVQFCPLPSRRQPRVHLRCAANERRVHTRPLRFLGGRQLPGPRGLLSL